MLDEGFGMTFRRSKHTGAMTADHRRRFDAIKDRGCIACRQRGLRKVYPEVHHLTESGRQLGHDFTVGLCPWHHRAQPFGDWLDAPRCRAALGPSLAEGSKPFYAAFGGNAELLERQNKLLETPA